METLGKLEPAALAPHAAAVVARLDDSKSVVRNAAVATLAKLEAAALALHAAAIVAARGLRCIVRHAAVEALGKLEPAALAPHEAAVRRFPTLTLTCGVRQRLPWTSFRRRHTVRSDQIELGEI